MVYKALKKPAKAEQYANALRQWVVLRKKVNPVVVVVVFVVCVVVVVLLMLLLLLLLLLFVLLCCCSLLAHTVTSVRHGENAVNMQNDIQCSG